nr:MAG TPA: helix-turn-helix domain protein [Caudoviricetes sp.]
MNTLTIGERIKALRQEQNYSVDEMAKRAGISRATYYRYESADAENLPIKTIKVIAKALNTTPEYILGLTDDKRTKEWSMIESYNENLKLRHEASLKLRQEIYEFIASNSNTVPYLQLLNLIKFIGIKHPEYLEGMYLVLDQLHKDNQLHYTIYERILRGLSNGLESIKLLIDSMENSDLKDSQSLAIGFLKNSYKQLIDVKSEIENKANYERDCNIVTENARNKIYNDLQGYIINNSNN